MKKKTKKNLTGAFFMFIGIAFIVLSIVIVTAEGKKEQEHGVKTTAEVTEVNTYYEEDSSGERTEKKEVYVSYKADGEKIESKLSSYKGDLSVGDKIDVYYLDDDPYEVRQIGANKLLLYIGCGMGAVFVLIGLILILVPAKYTYDMKGTSF